MFLQHSPQKVLIEILNLEDLWDPCSGKVFARIHGETEMQEPELYAKKELVFLSGEALPRAWIDPNYDNEEKSTENSEPIKAIA